MLINKYSYTSVPINKGLNRQSPRLFNREHMESSVEVVKTRETMKDRGVLVEPSTIEKGWG